VGDVNTPAGDRGAEHPDVLSGDAVRSVSAVVSRMEGILERLPQSDGVACFTRLYLDVTESVQRDLDGGAFSDAAFLIRLDTTFAGLFFDALDAYLQSPHDAPPAWRPLFDARSARGIAPLQFALAGMNAHINRDLPVALVSAWSDAGLEPRLGSPQHGDYERVNDVLARVEARIKHRYLTGWLKRLDRLLHRFHRLGDVLAMWDIRRARATAWVNGEALWALRGEAQLRTAFLLALDRTTGLGTRGLLIPADTTLDSMDRRLRRMRRDPLWWA
jgi:Family of unknown function (DUF5995)